MINVKPQVYSALCEYCPDADVSDGFPQQWEQTPKVTFTEENNSTETYDAATNRETHAYLTYRVDVWAEESTSGIASQADAAMVSLGFLRTMARDIEGEKYKHKQMRYECIIDVDTKATYHNI